MVLCRLGEKHTKKNQLKSTKHYVLFKLIYKEKFSLRAEARDFERYLKIRSNKEKLLRKLNYL